MNLERIINTDIEFIDGDRGQNYPSKSEFFENGYCVFLNTGNITRNGFDFSKLDFITEEKDKSLRKGKVKSDDIILTTRGTVGNVALVTETIKYANMRINSGMVIIRSKKDFTPLFLNTFFRSELFKKQALTNGSGSAQPQLPISALKNISIPKLDKKTQDKITSVVSALDEKIALNNETNATLEQMAKTLYDYWFVQFDFPDDNGKPYKSSGGEMVYNETLKRDIPKGWDVKKLADWIKTDKSGDWGQEEPKGNYQLEVTCIRGADINPIKNQGIIEAPTRFILEKNANKLLSDFDFVIEISGGSPTQSTGRIASISPSTLCRFDKPLICSNFCKAISLKDNSYFYNFAFLWNQIYENDILFGWEGKTSGIKNLLFDNFVQSYYEPLPPVEIADKFFQKMDVINSQQQTLLKQNAELTKLRDWLLPMLMNGQVTVQ